MQSLLSKKKIFLNSHELPKPLKVSLDPGDADTGDNFQEAFLPKYIAHSCDT